MTDLFADDATSIYYSIETRFIPRGSATPVQFRCNSVCDFRLKDKKMAAPKLERPLQSRTISIRRSLGMYRLQHQRLPRPHWRATDAIVVKAGCLSMQRADDVFSIEQNGEP